METSLLLSHSDYTSNWLNHRNRLHASMQGEAGLLLHIVGSAGELSGTAVLSLPCITLRNVAVWQGVA